MKNYNESMLESMSNGVITLDEDGRIVTCNAAGLRILQAKPAEILNRPAADFFTETNAWVVDKVRQVEETQTPDTLMDAELKFPGRQSISANVTVLPLVSGEDKKLGTMIMIEDISSEKRMKSTMSRYMAPGLPDQLLKGGEEIGRAHV